jgi:hypothetical protein
MKKSKFYLDILVERKREREREREEYLSDLMFKNCMKMKLIEMK